MLVCAAGDHFETTTENCGCFHGQLPLLAPYILQTTYILQLLRLRSCKFKMEENTCNFPPTEQTPLLQSSSRFMSSDFVLKNKLGKGRSITVLLSSFILLPSFFVAINTLKNTVQGTYSYIWFGHTFMVLSSTQIFSLSWQGNVAKIK